MGWVGMGWVGAGFIMPFDKGTGIENRAGRYAIFLAYLPVYSVGGARGRYQQGWAVHNWLEINVDMQHHL